MAYTPPTMQPLQFSYAQPTDYGGMMKNLGSTLGKVAPGLLNSATSAPPQIPGQAIPGAVGPTAAGGPNGPQPLVNPGTMPQGPMPPPAAPNLTGQPPANVAATGQPAQPGLLNVIKGMQPPQILSMLQNMTRSGQNVGAQLPGSAAFGQAGMMPSTFGG